MFTAVGDIKVRVDETILGVVSKRNEERGQAKSFLEREWYVEKSGCRDNGREHPSRISRLEHGISSLRDKAEAM